MYDEEQSPYAGYDPGGLTPEQLLSRLNALQGRIASTIARVERDGDAISEKQSQIVQEVDSISLEVFETDSTTGEKISRMGRIEARADSIELSLTETESTVSGHSSKISAIELDIDGIQTTVADHEAIISDPTTGLATRMTSAESSITQNANEITSRVTYTEYQADMDGTGGLKYRMSSAESSITQNASAITSKVSSTDYNGATVVSMINQTAETIKIQAKNIDLLGIVQVASTLKLGTGGTAASIRFNDTDSWIRTYGGGLAIESFGNILFDLGNAEVEFGINTTVDLGSAKAIIWGNNGPTNVAYASNAGNADTLDGYHASAFSLSGHTHSNYSLSGHEHADSSYVKPSSGQSIKIGLDTTNKRANWYLNGSYIGSSSFA